MSWCISQDDENPKQKDKMCSKTSFLINIIFCFEPNHTIMVCSKMKLIFTIFNSSYIRVCMCYFCRWIPRHVIGHVKNKITSLGNCSVIITSETCWHKWCIKCHLYIMHIYITLLVVQILTFQVEIEKTPIALKNEIM